MVCSEKCIIMRQSGTDIERKEESMLMRVGLLLLLSGLAGCAPEVGSDAWCENLKGKKKSDWTIAETKDYTRHCLFN